MKNDENVNSLKYFLYTRKSSEDEEKQVLSIQSQKDIAKEKFGDLKFIEVFEETKSAFKPHNRPIFKNMVERIQKGDADGIIAWHPDRISRNEIDAATITYMLRTGQLKDLKFCSYTFDNSPEGIMMLQMALSQSQFSSAKLGKDVKRGMEQKVKMGWRPGVVPQGYLNDKHGEKGEKTVISDPERFQPVRRMWDMMLTGNYTVPKIWEIIDKEWGYKTIRRKKSGGGPISKSGLYEMFTNYFYTGNIVYKDKIYPGKHEPMISIEEFDRVQFLLGRKGKPKPQTHEFAFTGLIRCGECGCLYTAETKPRYSKRTGKTKNHTYYHCTWKKKEHRCSQRKCITIDNLETQIENEINKYTILPEFRDWAIEYIKKNNDIEIEDRSKIYEMQHKAVTKTQSELDELTKMRYRNLIDDEAFLRDKLKLQQEMDRLKEALHDTEKRAEKWLELTEKTFNFAVYARKEFQTGSLQKKREIFSALGQNITIKDEKLTLEANSWLMPIAEAYPEIEREYLKVRTNKNGLIKAKTEDFTSVHTYWLRVVDNIRTAIKNHNDYIYVPDCSGAEL